MMLKKYKNTILTITIVVGIMIPTISTIIILNSLTINSISTYESSLQWITPTNHSSIIFGTGEAEFEFEYSYNSEFIDQVKLFMNGIFISDVTDKNEVQLNYNENLDGWVEATLKGYLNGKEIENDSVNLYFSKLIEEKTRIYDSGMVDLGMQLFLILHDPHGDLSFSRFISKYEGERFSMGIRSESIVETMYNFNSSYDLSTFTCENGSLYGFDCLYILPESTTITLSSMMEISNAEIIGPGYGDRYWGEHWELNWSFMGTRQIFFNGTVLYINPCLLYEIHSTGEYWESNIHAPQEWKDLNPCLNDFPDYEVEWGNSYDLVNATNTLSSSVNIMILNIISIMFGLSTNNLGFTLFTRNNNVHTSYFVGDDDGSDIINNEIGIDKNFGTVIFKNIDSQTSNPWEYNTLLV